MPGAEDDPGASWEEYGGISELSGANAMRRNSLGEMGKQDGSNVLRVDDVSRGNP